MLNIIAASEERTFVVEVDEVGIPVGCTLTSKERRIGRHADDVAITLDMQQIKAFGQGIN